jgi:starvation-inducible DNA-binding protein
VKTATLAQFETGARESIASELQPVLVDLINLALQGKQAHWNVSGPLFRPVHAELDAIVDDARAWSDDVAERIVTIGMPAFGQADHVAAASALEALPNRTIGDRQAVEFMIARVATVVKRAREAMEHLGELDLASQDLIIEIVRGLEKHLWMLRVQVE